MACLLKVKLYFTSLKKFGFTTVHKYKITVRNKIYEWRFSQTFNFLRNYSYYTQGDFGLPDC